jgi:hypothetical protein
MRRRAVFPELAILSALAATGACAQIDGLSGLHYDGGADAGGATGSGGSGSPGSSGVTGSGAGGAGVSSTGATGGSGAKCGEGDSCVDVPNGWSGPIVLVADSLGTMACPASYPKAAFSGGTKANDDPVTCNACACDAAPCGSFQLLVYQDGACANVLVEDNIPDNAGCTMYNPAGGFSMVLSHTPGSGGCNPSGGGVASRPATHFVDATVGCGLASSAKRCGGGGVCAPAIAGMKTCVYQENAGSDCPGGFPNATTIFTSIKDTRGCSDCACGSPGNDCNGEVILYANPNCSGGGDQILPPDGLCHVGTQFQSAEPTTASPCNPNGGAPMGATGGADAMTVCCE